MSALHVHVEQHKHYTAYIVYVTQTKKWQNCKAKLFKVWPCQENKLLNSGLADTALFQAL
jgi:hypothetical protein